MSRDRLATVLRLRQLDEQHARVRLHDALAARARAVADVGRCAVARAAEERWVAQLHAGGATGADYRAAASVLTSAVLAQERAVDALHRADGSVATARGRLAEVTKRREVVERLIERHRAMARLAAERREIARLSDVATTQYVYRSGRQAG